MLNLCSPFQLFRNLRFPLLPLLWSADGAGTLLGEAAGHEVSGKWQLLLLLDDKRKDGTPPVLGRP